MGIHLKNGDQVCIIGGGPAGSSAALHVLDECRKRGLELEVLIFEPRDFNQPGPGGCNRCAGILSSGLLQHLASLDVTLPEDVIQSDVQAYSVHLDGELFRIERPYPDRRIVSIYRGGGPRVPEGEPAASFDAFLLSQARARGARHIASRVNRVTYDDRLTLHTARGRYAADLVVLATGVNSRSPLDQSFGYRPPKTDIMAQDEFLRPSDWPDDRVSAFFRDPPGLIFGGLIPKGSYLNISLLGRGMTADSINDFIHAQGLSPGLPPPPGSLCGCTPRIAVGGSKKFFGDRWVAVGDAAVTRLYKDGIGSAFVTAQKAMETAVQDGISHTAFSRSYAPIGRKISRDNWYGRLLFQLWSFTLRRPSFTRAWVRTIQMESTWPQAQRVHMRVLWGMLTGDEPYRDLFWLSFKPSAMRSFLRGLFNKEQG